MRKVVERNKIMADEFNSKQFAMKFVECIKEWRKQMGDTRSEKDAAYFFDKSLKKFIRDNVHAFNILSTINCERNFLKWVNDYILEEP